MMLPPSLFDLFILVANEPSSENNFPRHEIIPKLSVTYLEFVSRSLVNECLFLSPRLRRSMEERNASEAFNFDSIVSSFWSKCNVLVGINLLLMNEDYIRFPCSKLFYLIYYLGKGKPLSEKEEIYSSFFPLFHELLLY
jgi:hypothetical protein